ncbi:type II toxin-antitoxin system Phd/YefM family antitoxin [Candidatus Gottesmanbacteria bacterium]|nr:type II toxin-antitoxin system Phd/YefM family antitoxin [Candidatus Gottesmanbacteria bacterium]
MNTTTITPRDILRNYKEVFNKVKTSKKPAIVVSQKKPQVAIVSLDDLEKLKIIKNRKSTEALLDLSGIIPRGSGLPPNLSQKHDKYTWD